MSLVNRMLQDLDRRQAQDAHQFIQQNDCLTQIHQAGVPAADIARPVSIVACFAVIGAALMAMWPEADRLPDNFYNVELAQPVVEEAIDVAPLTVGIPYTPLDWIPPPSGHLETAGLASRQFEVLDIEPPSGQLQAPVNSVFAPSHGPLPTPIRTAPEPAANATVQTAKAKPPVVDKASAKRADKPPTSPAAAVNKAPDSSLVTAALEKPKETISIKPAETSAEQSYKQARVHLDNWETHKAQKELNRTLIFDPGHNAARELLAALLLQDSKNVEAESILDVGLTLYPSHSPFAQLKARLMTARGDTSLAIELLRSVTPSPQYRFEHNAVLAALYQKQGNHERAVKTYLALIELRPETASLWSGLAMSLDAQGQYQAALKSYRQALTAKQLSPELRRYAQQRVQAINDAIGGKS